MGASTLCFMGTYCGLSTLGFIVVLALYMTSGQICSEDTVAGDKTEHIVGSTKVEIFSLDESKNVMSNGETCDCQPCFTTFSLLELLVLSGMAIGAVAASCKIWFILKKRYQIKQAQREIKKNKKLDAEIEARQSVLKSVGHVETMLAVDPAKPNYPERKLNAEKKQCTYETVN